MESMDYSTGLRIYCLHDVPAENETAIRTHPAVEELSAFPEYRLVRTACHPCGIVTANDFPPTEAGRQYGVVGLIDSGTDPNNPHLQAWDLERYEKFIKPEMQDNTHGSFVGAYSLKGSSSTTTTRVSLPSHPALSMSWS